ncbi:hypothetical protein INR49_018091 [Caranx melampygus]|nr:hypothetical protein INR49_018091 [Caranx melampygus]
MQHSSNDLLVYNNGTVKHTVIINAEVNCEVNLFNYPFAADECPVAIQTWTNGGCGTEMVLGDLKMVDSTHGDWQTDYVDYQQLREDRNYIMVALSIRQANPFITLLLPSILIIIADVGSCALPLGGGERNSFKVTLVLSFTMFLIILNEQLPGDSKCSPIIRIHFCVCLVLLVLSMLVSLLLTRLAKDGLISCLWSTPKSTVNRKKKEGEGTSIPAEDKPDITVIQLNGSEDKQMLRKVVNFLEGMEASNADCERYQTFASLLDKIFFWIYFILSTLYFCVMISIMVKHKCEVNHFDFWY